MTIAIGSLSEAVAKVSEQTPVSVEFDQNNSTLLLYAPFPLDQQTPHNRDEMYVVARGTARFVAGEAERAIVPGDSIFVSKAERHKFLDPSQDFAVWAFFYPTQ